MNYTVVLSIIFLIKCEMTVLNNTIQVQLYQTRRFRVFFLIIQKNVLDNFYYTQVCYKFRITFCTKQTTRRATVVVLQICKVIYFLNVAISVNFLKYSKNIKGVFTKKKQHLPFVTVYINILSYLFYYILFNYLCLHTFISF